MPFRSFVYAALVVSAVIPCVFAPASASAAETSKLEVIAKLGSDVLLVGETPKIVLTLKAPEGKDVQIVRKDRVYPRRALVMRIRDSHGKRVPGGGPGGRALRREDDFRAVPKGASVSMEFDVPIIVTKAGRYSVVVRFKPSPDDTDVREFEMPVAYKELGEGAVGERMSFRVSARPGPAVLPSDFHVLELTRVKNSPKKHWLVFRILGHDGAVRVCQRVAPLDADSHLAAVPKYFGEKARFAERHVVVAFNRGGELRVMRLEYPTGAVLQDIRIDESPKAGAARGQLRQSAGPGRGM